MRLLFLGALAAVLVAAWVKYFLRKQQTVGPPTRWPALTTVAVLVVLVPTAVMEWQWQATERVAGETVRWLSGRADAGAECQRMGGNLLFAGSESGRVMWEQDDQRGSGSQAWLTWDTCRELGQWLRSDKADPSVDQVEAVHVLVHEAMHVAGFRSESEAECQALAWDSAAAERLGARADEARRLVEVYLARLRPRLDSGYVQDCGTITAWQPPG